MTSLQQNQIYNRLRALLAESLGADEAEIDWDTNVFDDLNADVIEFHDEVIPLIEEAFKITIEDQDADELTTVRELVSYVAENA